MEVVVFLLILWVVFGLLGMWIAGQRHRDGGEGFMLGVLFGPLGVLVECLLPVGVSPAPPPTLPSAPAPVRIEPVISTCVEVGDSAAWLSNYRRRIGVVHLECQCGKILTLLAERIGTPARCDDCRAKLLVMPAEAETLRALEQRLICEQEAGQEAGQEARQEARQRWWDRNQVWLLGAGLPAAVMMSTVLLILGIHWLR